MTPAERLKQIEEDTKKIEVSVRSSWAFSISNVGRKEDLDALARLVALAKKGAEK